MRRPGVRIGILSALTVGAVLARLAIGGAPAGASADQWHAILSLRGARAASGVSVGAALAVSGTLLQSLLRNPLASPDLLGVASGAGLGVMAAAYLAYLAGHGIAYFGASTIGAAAGAFAVLAIVYFLSRRRGLIDPATMILIGVTLGVAAAAGMQWLQHLMADQGVASSRLLVGALRDDGPPLEIAGVGVLVLLATAFGCVRGSAMDALTLGDEEAASVGVTVGATRLGLFLLAGALAAGSVVLAGPIGFVGLIAPHLARMALGPAHRWAVPGAAMIGATLVVLADGLTRLGGAGSGRLPLNVVMTVVGAPVFLWMLGRARRG